MEHLPLTLTEYRARTGETWLALAKRLGVNAVTLRRIGIGERVVTDPEVVEKIKRGTRQMVTPLGLHRQRLIWWRTRHGTKNTPTLPTTAPTVTDQSSEGLS